MAARTQHDPAVWCIIVAGGSGTRFGTPKQYELLDGTRVIDRSVATAAASCVGVVVVVPEGDLAGEVSAGEVSAGEVSAGEVSAGEIHGREIPIEFVSGGRTRAESVRKGLEAVPSDVRFILVHDAARPLASRALFDRVTASLFGGADAVVPAVNMVDTLRSVDGRVLDRERVVAVQTPQGFAAEVLRRAHSGGGDASDDASLVEQLGVPVTLVEGERSNLKLTEPVDLRIAGALIGELARGDRS